jgi:hypothetical protein
MVLDYEQMANWETGVGLVGLTGKAGSGKTTAAQVLVDAGWHRVKFAGPLKDMLRGMGLTDRHIEGDLKEVPCDLLGGQTPRYAMQTLGTEWGRGLIHPDLWIMLARQRIVTAMAAGLNVVVDDVRFENEAAVIRDLGGYVVGLERGDGAGGHISEAGVAADLVYQNTGTEAELRGWIAYVFLMLGDTGE